MSQKLSVEINIPEDYVVIKKDDYLELLDQPVTGDMKWLMQQTGIKTHATLSTLLKKHRETYDLDYFVIYPEDGGWRFLKEPTKRFISDNYHLFKL